jgi:hypothetical protein
LILASGLATEEVCAIDGIASIEALFTSGIYSNDFEPSSGNSTGLEMEVAYMAVVLETAGAGTLTAVLT